MREELQKYFYALTSVARALRSIGGVDFELIGSMVLPVGYGMYWDVHDVDLFVIGESPFMNRINSRSWREGMIGTWARRRSATCTWRCWPATP